MANPSSHASPTQPTSAGGQPPESIALSGENMLAAGDARRSAVRSILSNAGSLFGTALVTSLLGFPFWWLAARSFSPDAVGSAAALISAMMLLGMISTIGLGTMLMGELPRRPDQRVQLVMTASVATSAAGLLLGLGFAIIAPTLLGLHALEGSLFAILLFAIGVSLTSATMVVDQALIGLLRGTLQLIRNGIFSASKLLLVALIGVFGLTATGLALYGTWVVGLALSAAWLALVARRRHVRLLQGFRWRLPRGLQRVTLEHYFLNLALPLSTLVMPLVVAGTLSVEATAYYYAASLIAGILAYGGVALTTALFPVGVANNRDFPSTLRFTLVASFGLTTITAVGLIFASHVLLTMFGPGYAANATGLLQVMAVYGLFQIVKDHYVAIARIRGTVTSAAILCTLGSGMEIIMGAIGAIYGGLTWLAIGMLAALILQAIVMAPRIVREAGWLGSVPRTA